MHGLVLGSVTHAVVLHATCPVVVVPLGTDGGHPAATLAVPTRTAVNTPADPADRQPRARQTGYEPGGSAGPGPGSERRWCRPTGHAEHVRAAGNGLLGKLEQVVLVIAAVLLTAAAVVPGPGT